MTVRAVRIVDEKKKEKEKEKEMRSAADVLLSLDLLRQFRDRSMTFLTVLEESIESNPANDGRHALAACRAVKEWSSGAR